MDGQPILEIERPRSATELIGATFSLYRRYPWLFLVLAAVVIVPYELLDAIPTFGLVHGVAKGLLGFAVGIADIALVLPLISALHVYAVDDVRQGRRPDIGSVARRGMATLAIVSPAVLLSWLGITAGLIALIVPGVLLYLRWSVVAQTASLEAKDWRQALARSRLLTYGRYRHVFALLLLVAVITWSPSLVIHIIFGLKTTVASFLIDAVISIPVSSFTALATAMLYFDLKARMQSEGPHKPALPSLDPGPDLSAASVQPTGHSLDPASWSDEDRPPGWYVDPDAPWVMRYWAADGGGAWSKRTTKTPKDTLAEWRDTRWTREQAERPEEPA
jgi:hypothetical protein